MILVSKWGFSLDRSIFVGLDTKHTPNGKFSKINLATFAYLDKISEIIENNLFIVYKGLLSSIQYNLLISRQLYLLYLRRQIKYNYSQKATRPINKLMPSSVMCNIINQKKNFCLSIIIEGNRNIYHIYIRNDINVLGFS